ncbi:hypothetical protein [Fuscibacter oryzae]|uniref:Uncharacterized protein n=1 Tax=Fuscibacter oryzae TaxID=2803939 RepID=A0A8J7MS42_9RHOB|nr:hypothetical protein [Fuscibacter oryzae]MBL4929313.1 hypothetical protein [Fuscibacter oryzae]
MIKALQTVDLILDSEAKNISELVEIASNATGISEDRILFRIDLESIDLTQEDITKLLGKSAIFSKAILTPSQRKRFEIAARETAQRERRRTIQRLSYDQVYAFIEKHGGAAPPIFSMDGKRTLSFDALKSAMMFPIKGKPSGTSGFEDTYFNRVLKNLEDWANPSNLPFFLSLFDLAGSLGFPITPGTAEVLNGVYLSTFGLSVGDMISKVSATKTLDSYWITGKRGFNLKENTTQISRNRSIHPAAIENALDELTDARERIEFLSFARFDCDQDSAERIAARITKSDWPSNNAAYFLNAKVHSRVRGAIFRQLLGQGEESRIVEVLRWLDGNRGAVGALSLESAFSQIRSFEIGIQFAEEAGKNFANNQLKVVIRALRNLSSSDADRRRLESLCQRLNYKMDL